VREMEGAEGISDPGVGSLFWSNAKSDPGCDVHK
jgi:hypothetical protein